MSSNPDFILCSGEGYGLLWPRNCWVEKKILSKTEGEFVLLSVNPSVSYQDTNGNEILLDKIFVKNRHSNISLLCKDNFPIYVYILMPKKYFLKIMLK